MALNARVQELLTALERERDELRVKLNLAGKDLRDELDALDARLDAFRAKATSAATDARERAGDAGDVLGETARTLAEDLRAGYAKLREAVRKSD